MRRALLNTCSGLFQTVLAWKVLRNTVLWAMRGVLNPDVGSTEGHLQEVMGDPVQAASVNAPGPR